MKKIFVLLVIMLVGVLTSACVNNFAVKELNEIAAQYLEQGDVNSAIARLESSVDLDGNVYQSRYNLAVSYLRIGECQKALNNIQAAEALIENEPAVFYTLGVANNCLGDELFEKKDENGDLQEVKYETVDKEIAVAKMYINYLTVANENYEKYVKMQPNADDTKQVLETIAINKEKILEKKSKYNLD